MKTTIKSTLLAMILLFAIAVNAQDKPLTFGVKAGVNISNVSGDFQDAKAKIGFNAGVTLDYALVNNFYLLTGLDFTTKGSKVAEDMDLKMNLSYLQLPVHVGYKLPIGDDSRILLHAGPYIAFGVDGKWKMSGDGVEASIGAFSDEVNEYGLKMKRFDFGLGFGLGAEFGKINAGVNCDFGLMNIADFGVIDLDELGEFDGSNVSVKNMNVSISVGYKF